MCYTKYIFIAFWTNNVMLIISQCDTLRPIYGYSLDCSSIVHDTKHHKQWSTQTINGCRGIYFTHLKVWMDYITTSICTIKLPHPILYTSYHHTKIDTIWIQWYNWINKIITFVIWFWPNVICTSMKTIYSPPTYVKY